jgi:MFS family permease
MHQTLPAAESPDASSWYTGITRYQWIVLAIAAAGWAFDQYESQIYVLTKDQILLDLAGLAGAARNRWTDYLNAIFLLGSASGGLLAGTLADRFGRRPLLIATILFYSLFSGVTYFATGLGQLCIIRFLVAMGIGGEWAVGASLVAETFSRRARAYTSGMFHSSSVIGIWMATCVGLAVGANWRYAYLVGILPAFLTFWVLARVHEPEKWQHKADSLHKSATESKRLGSFRELLRTPQWRRRALLGCALAGVGLATFWGVMVAGQDLIRDLLVRNVQSQTHFAYGSPELDQAIKDANVVAKTRFAYGFVQTAGSGLGMILFGPISARIGRRAAFIGFHLLSFIYVPIACYAPQTYWQLLIAMPIFGFLTLSFHAGYAIYFPELFPTHLRATGTSFCFNGGRILAAPMLFLSAWLKGSNFIDLRLAVTCFGALFLIGAVIMLYLPETNRQELLE